MSVDSLSNTTWDPTNDSDEANIASFRLIDGSGEQLQIVSSHNDSFADNNFTFQADGTTDYFVEVTGVHSADAQYVITLDFA